MNTSQDKPQKSNNGYLAVSVGIAILILFIGFGWYFSDQPGPAQQAAQDASTADSGTDTAARGDATQADDDAAPGGDGATGGDAADGGSGTRTAMRTDGGDAAAGRSEDAPAGDEDSAGRTPTFDTVRIEPDGDTVVAGLAAPDATVRLFANDLEIASSKADAGGNWAIVLDTPLPAGASDLWVSAEKGGGEVRSEQQLAVVIDPEGKSTPLVVVQDGTGSRVMQEATQVVSAKEQSVSDATPGDAAQDAPARADTSRNAAADDAGADNAADEARDTTAAGRDGGGDGDTPAAARAGDEDSADSDAGARMAARDDDDAGDSASGDTSQDAGEDVVLRIEAADFDDDGNVYISGTAEPDATVRVYYDNELLGDTIAGADGRWSLRAERPLDGGVHQLRADRVEPGSGQVMSRAEVSLIARIPGEEPDTDEERAVADAGNADGAASAQGELRRDTDGETNRDAERDTASNTPAPTDEGTMTAGRTSSDGDGEAGDQARPGRDMAAAGEAGAGQARPRLFTVQRGDNLWRIARNYYGRGIRYTTIFEANKDQIRDPDLIYPEQVFLIPRRVESEAAAN